VHALVPFQLFGPNIGLWPPSDDAAMCLSQTCAAKLERH
jgi:hypothetical protein